MIIVIVIIIINYFFKKIRMDYETMSLERCIELLTPLPVCHLLIDTHADLS